MKTNFENWKSVTIYYIALVMIIITSSWSNAGEISQANYTFTRIWPAPTCSFKKKMDTILLDEIPANAFRANEQMHGYTEFSVGVQCEENISRVLIRPSGTSDIKNRSAFKNTGGASNVALRLTALNNVVMLPDGTSSVELTPPPGGGDINKIFAAGYVATDFSNVGSGTFESVVNFTIEYE